MPKKEIPEQIVDMSLQFQFNPLLDPDKEKARLDAVAYGVGYMRMRSDGTLEYCTFWDGTAEAIKLKNRTPPPFRGKK